MKTSSTIPSNNLPKILALVGLLIIVFSLVFSDIARQNFEKQRTAYENTGPDGTGTSSMISNTEGLDIFNTIELFGFLIGAGLLFSGIWTWYQRAQVVWDQTLKENGTTDPEQITII
ncbi:hypothetical protein [Dyadobacter sandarakinus]|uniref:Uncharacterized protein n=1 Tax=Dyadobacter sandarakinus TaxID=2747268 RepID=A0ABX7I3P6_9BACT|nr:hypothetical protein [Dyadobacter sandarakinus]QRR00694.1 hypothetical protein HWI92_07130 [Dyadobacter sandarakinus]